MGLLCYTTLDSASFAYHIIPSSYRYGLLCQRNSTCPQLPFRTRTYKTWSKMVFLLAQDPLQMRPVKRIPFTGQDLLHGVHAGWPELCPIYSARFLVSNCQTQFKPSTNRTRFPHCESEKFIDSSRFLLVIGNLAAIIVNARHGCMHLVLRLHGNIELLVLMDLQCV